jgi:hypothetical protein
VIAAILAWRRKRPQHALLPRRMAALDVDADKVRRIEPTVFRDLQSLCAACAASEQCEGDLMHNPGNPGWQDYCPNAATLSALGGLGLFGPPARPWPAGLERPPRRLPF